MGVKRVIRFGAYEVDFRAGELRKKGLKIKLQEQPLQILAMLAERPGDVVTRDELRQRLWPADTFVDFNHSLNTAIKRLRDALGDSAENPRFIETLASRGYRFIAPLEWDTRASRDAQAENAGPLVEPCEAPESVEAISDEIGTLLRPPAAAQGRNALPWRKVAIATVALVVLAAGSLWLIRRKSRPAPQAASYVVAVLPFANLSTDPENEYFSDGLTEEVIQSLAAIEGLEVTSRTSSFALKGARLDIREIGAKLNATLLLEGSVRRVGNQLRITAQLIRANDGRHLWSNTYDRETHEVFAIQEEIAESIANALRLRLATGQRKYTDNLEAHDLYLRGRYALEQLPEPGQAGAKNGLRYFEQAIVKDANYAPAYAGTGDALVWMDNFFLLPHEQAYAQAKTAAGKALELDPKLSEAHTTLGLIRAREYAWQEAERSFRRAIELNPNNALAHLELGYEVLIVQERFEEGLREVGRAVALDPLSPHAGYVFASALLLAGRYKEAEDEARKSILLDRTRITSFEILSRALSLQGKAAQALTAVSQSEGTVGWQACVYARAGQRDQAVRLLEKNLRGAYRQPAPARRLAEIYACLGDKERTLEYLEKTHAKHEGNFPHILEAPEIAWMRSEPRFAALRQKLNLAAR
jgi:TolB-like protein/DNA-binding winged helix-turn-helix (wHTH) protein